MNKQRGFTLIELLVVIAIIGILSSVVLASLNGARKKGRDARRISDLKQIQLALEMYYDSNSSEYPDTLSLLAPTYISQVPTDPSGGGACSGAYCYDNLTNAAGTCSVSGGVCSNYVIGATLEDPTSNVFGSEDINSNVGVVSCVDPVYCVMP